jgi:2-keto-4-pentenoate hydratase
VVKSLLMEAARERVGWKAGFGTAKAMEQLGISAPLAAPLTRATLLDDGAEQAVGDWTAARLEPELAVRVGDDGGVAAVAPAIELVDLHGPSDDVEAILAAGIFHRAWVLGEFRPPELDGITLDVGDHEGADPYALTGRPEDVVRALAGSGTPIAPGDVVICGSAVPALEVAPGDQVTVRFNGLGEVGVRLV